MAKITDQEREVVALLEQAFRNATGESYLLNKEYPLVVTWNRQTRRMSAFRKVANGTLYLKTLGQHALGPLFVHYTASPKTGVRSAGVSHLCVHTPEVRAQLLQAFNDLFSNITEAVA
jgi:hypothetical protein